MRSNGETFFKFLSMVLLGLVIGILITYAVVKEKPTIIEKPLGITLTSKEHDPGLAAGFGNPFWIADMAEKSQPFVVNIQVKGKDVHTDARKKYKEFKDDERFKEYFRFFGPFFEDVPEFNLPKVPRMAEGSGFIIRSDGLILTNAHVVQGAPEITVSLNDERSFKAKLVGYDLILDVALIKIPVSGLATAPLGDSDKVRVGEPVVAIGSPFGLRHTVTAGIISARGRKLYDDPRGNQDLFQTDAAINHGSSGGPLLNYRGEVIGINQAIIPSGDRIGFAIPINSVKEVLEKLEKNGKIERPAIQAVVATVTDKLREESEIEVSKGVYIASVMKGGPADNAGISPGDVVLEIDGKAVATNEELIKEIAKHSVEDKVILTVAKGGKKEKQEKVAVILGELDTAELQPEGE